MAVNLLRMLRNAGVRRRVIRFRPISPKPAHVHELNAIYQALVDIWDAGSDRIMAAYKPASPVTGDATPEDLNRIIELVALETTNATVVLTARIKEWGKRVERWHRQAFADGVLAATSIRIDTVLSPFEVTETVGAAVARNVELIKDVDATTRGRIGEIVFRGVSNRTPNREVQKEIREAVGMSRTRARNIAIDQTVKLSSSLDRARQEEVGIAHFTWRHSHKAHPRQAHVARDGKLYKWRADGPAPGADPPSDLPGFLPYCGCKAQATLVDSRGQVI